MTALDTVTPWLACPVCGGGLTAAAGALRCDRSHSFDVARQGYVNLLGRSAPANADSPAMVAARDRFLSAGHYAPISRMVVDAVARRTRILEVGAGTGHHLAHVLDEVSHATGLATDVSVPACRRAARAHPRMAAVVANTWDRLPLADGSVDAVVCIFAPRNPVEFARVLAPGGLAVVVMPEADHLAELRRTHRLLDVAPDKVPRLLHSAHGHLELLSSTALRYDVALSGPEVTDLVAMGPNAFHTAPVLEGTTVRVSVRCVVLRR